VISSPRTPRQEPNVDGVCIFGCCLPVPLSDTLTLGSQLREPLGPTAGSLASKPHPPPTNSIFTLLGYRFGDEQETSLLLTGKKAEFIQN